MTIDPRQPHGFIERVLYNNLLSPKLNDQQKAHNLKILKAAAVLFTLCTLGFGYLLVQRFKTTFTDYQNRINAATTKAASPVLRSGDASTLRIHAPPPPMEDETSPRSEPDILAQRAEAASALRPSASRPKPPAQPDGKVPSPKWEAYVRPLLIRLAAMAKIHPELESFLRELREAGPDDPQVLTTAEDHYPTLLPTDQKTLYLFRKAKTGIQNQSLATKSVTLREPDYAKILSVLEQLPKSFDPQIEAFITYVQAQPSYDELSYELELFLARTPMPREIEQPIITIIEYLDKRAFPPPLPPSPVRETQGTGRLNQTHFTFIHTTLERVDSNLVLTSPIGLKIKERLTPLVREAQARQGDEVYWLAEIQTLIDLCGRDANYTIPRQRFLEIKAFLESFGRADGVGAGASSS